MGRQDLVDRITELGQDAKEEEVEPSGRSAADLASLVVGQRLVRPMLSMTDGGTYRAMWKGEGWQAAIHFLGDARVNFVVAHSVGGKLDRNYGSSAIGPIKRYLKALKLWEKMRASREEAGA
ncbi:hypothetical protein [Rhizobium sp. BK176]|uniref:hypothetical protein n=1 Tax=Rhizobium sp. BK176 TaxID=2587071 RepID=UPI00216A558C|nr:hypothetical protein [Rhizobium sp. BK176]MCS4088946.1 hypothetical protein [Rhizobium sp. BK176]